MERNARANETAAKKRSREELEMLNDDENIEIEYYSGITLNTCTVETQKYCHKMTL